MGKIRRFLGILSTLAFVFFATNSFAGDFSCPNTKKYTSCKSGYYLSDCGTTQADLENSVGETITFPSVKNSCVPCPAGWVCEAGNSCPTQCDAGSHVDNNKCVANNYTVSFNDNNSTSGTMESQSFKYGELQKLTANTFTRTGYTFQGWATSSTATTVTYADGASVSNLTDKNNGIVTLYAVWSANQITCDPGQYLPADSETCETCTEKNYCRGGIYSYNKSKKQGISPCPGSFTMGGTGLTSEDQCVFTLAPGDSIDGCSFSSVNTFGSCDTIRNYACPGFSVTYGDVNAKTVDSWCTGDLSGHIKCPANSTTQTTYCTCNTGYSGWIGGVGGVKVDKITTSTATCKIEYYECEPGTYLPKGKTACETCPAGSYCEGMDNLLVNPDKDQGIKSCGEGYYSNNGASSSDECIPEIYYVNFYCDNSKESIIDTQDVTFGGNIYGQPADVVNNKCKKTGYEPLQYICTNINVPLDGTTQYVSSFAEECFVEWNQISIDCPAGTYLPARSTSAANCTLCEAGSYCPGGSAFTLNDTKPQGIFDCASVGTGNYNLSDAGASSADECYTMTKTACYDPCEGASRCTTCPENFSRCAYETTATLTVIRYFSGDNVEIGERTCPIKTGTEDNVCDTSHYFSEETNDCSNSCESLGGQCQNHDGTTGSCWNSSSKATPSKGTNACYGFGCKATCDLFNDYLIYSDGTFYDTPINHCPKNANCTDNTESNDSIQSYRWYPQTICTPSRPCTFTYTCNAGYVASTTGDITYGSYRTLNGSPTTAVTLASCDPGVFVVELDPNGGVGGTSNIWQKYTVGWFSDEAATKSLSTIQIPTRENYRFLGYFLDGTEVIDMDGIVNPGASNLFTSNGGVITAQWERLQTECKAGKDVDDAVCQPGYYCPGGWVDAGTEYDKNTGCMRLCPTDKINGNVSSAEYSDDITDCYAVRSNVELGDKTGAGDQTCYYGTSEYDAKCNIKITSCVAGRYREAENSQTCALVGIGAYSVEGSVEKMLCSALAGANEYTTTSVDNASAPTQCYNTCNNITIDNGQRVPKQSSVYYDNTNIPACEYTTQCNTGYTGLGEACYPKVFTITLDKDAEDATQPVNTIYLKYNDGWYSKSTVGANGQPDATDRIESVAIPTRPAYSFGGYLNYDGDIVIGPDGRLSANYTMFVGNTTLTASWELKPTVTCEPGLYYEGAGEYCTACPAGAYCGGVTTYQDEKVVKGIEYCADLNGTYVAGKDASGNALNVVVTSEKYSETKTDCYAVNVEYVSGTNRATGSQTCAYDDTTKSYSANCWDVKVNTCIAGHWLQDATDTDCIEVDYGYYSAAGSLNRVACPNLGAVENVTTQSTTSEKVTQCYLGDRWVETQNGAQRLSCYHIDNASVTDVAQGYSYQCAMPVIVACAAGYYDDGAYVNTDGVRDCAPVGKDYYSPEQTFFTNEPEQPLSANPGSSTLRTQCPVDGRTDTTTAGRASACYKEKIACDITNGKGENTCHYDDTKGAYALDCTTCIVTGCDENFSQVGNTCIGCPEDNVCSGGEKKTCSELTGGKYEYADEGTTDVAYCYRDCVLGQNATQMSGRDYYGSGVADTCQITACQAGYYLNNGQCVTCPAGSVCTTDEPGNTPKTCSELTGGLYTMSAPGASSIDACYKECEEYAVTNGTAVPVEDTVFYPFECEFEGRSPTGNPCDIINNVCIETSCNYNFELIDGVCTPCARENAISYKQGGNCVVESCVSGFHPNGQACEPNVIECSAPNAVASAQKWDSNKNAFGECIITECADGYHLGANACQVDEQVCELENGIGVREWNHNTNTWGECIATSCNPGYTNDRGLTNENWKQCGRCNNMYSANGELAASSYVRGCEIASCMYQGELYTLENNECRLICDTYSDETGSRKWNASRQKCEHTCAPGYTTW